MLAKNFKDYKDKINWPVIVQVKFNGLRCIASKSGLFTRKGEKYISVPHIEESLKPFFQKYPSAILDGELFNFNLRERLNEIVTLVRKTKHITQEDLNKSEKIVRYNIYDGYGFENHTQDIEYQTRKSWIDKHVSSYYEYCEKVDDYIVKTQEELDKVYGNFLSQNHEGAIIRIPDSSYENKRSKNLLKYKPVEDAEFTIVDVQEGSGPWANKAKRIVLKEGFDAAFKGTMEEAEEMLRNKKNYIGKIVRIHYFGLTGLGTPNYGQFDYNNWKVGDK